VDDSTLRRRSSPEESTLELLTNPGPAAIAVVRLCGSAVARFLQRYIRTGRAPAAEEWKPGDVWRAELIDASGVPLDDILISVHAPPPQWDLRLHLHGSPALLRCCTALLTEGGLVELRGGERPLWQTCDAIEAEAYALLPRMLTLRGARWLLHQAQRLRIELERLVTRESPEEARQACSELAGRVPAVEWFSQPARVALVGPPNAGKSTLANALADQAVSLVYPAAGTTRDWVDVPGHIRGFPVVWVDTAGLRHSNDALEAAAVGRTRTILDTADAVVVVLDATPDARAAREAFLATYSEIRPACVALNKSDLPVSPEAVAAELPPAWRARAPVISAVQRTGFDGLFGCVLDALNRVEAVLERPGAFTERQVSFLKLAAAAVGHNDLMNAVRRCLFDLCPAEGWQPSQLASLGRNEI
jgi:tRNA modification GTPase